MSFASYLRVFIALGGRSCAFLRTSAGPARGWPVALRYSHGGTKWYLGADGVSRRICEPKKVLFLKRADATVAAVFRRQYFRRINHPVLSARRRKALNQGATCLPGYDV